jgi:hypothetical protein
MPSLVSVLGELTLLWSCSSETEALLQTLVIGGVGAHLLLAMGTAWYIQGQGRPWVTPFFKVSLYSRLGAAGL